MSPLVLPHTRSLLDTQPSQSPAFMSTTAGRVVFILCIVFGSLLLCLLVAALVYFVRRHKRKKRDTLTLSLHREASFIAGAPSVIDIIPPQPARRPSTRNANAAQSPRIVIPSPELGSVFRLDALPNMPRRGSSAVTRSRSGSGSPTPKAPTPPYESLFSGASTVITCSGMDKYDVPLRVMNHSSLASSIEPQLQKPTPAYRTGRNSSQEHLVSSKASADSLFSGSTSTPPLSPAIWSHSGTIHSPTDVSLATAATIHKSPSEQSFSTVASSPPRVALRCIELPPELNDAEQTPRAYGPLSRPPPVDQHEQPAGMTGTPVTLSHFPFRFSCDAPSSPGLSVVHGSPVPSSSLGALSPHRSYAHLSIRASPAHALGLHAALADSQQSLPSHSTPALKLKLKHRASDEIIAIVFAPQSINFAAVSDAVRGRLGFEPRRVWSDEGTEVTNDASLWSWLEEQYTQGHTRLMLHVE